MKPWMRIFIKQNQKIYFTTFFSKYIIYNYSNLNTIKYSCNGDVLVCLIAACPCSNSGCEYTQSVMSIAYGIDVYYGIFGI